jgi:hypothetical protein
VSKVTNGGGRVEVVGIWRIVEMDLWDIDAIDLTQPAFVPFDGDGDGGLRFVAVQGQLDWRTSAQGQGDRVEFTWEGDDEGDRVSGRGWAQVDEDGSLRGHIYFHLGDDSGFRAVRDISSDSGTASVTRSWPGSCSTLVPGR